MPLEHFGRGSWPSYQKRPLSDISTGAAMSRASPDEPDGAMARMQLRDGDQDHDEGVLSKLTGVSRSVSWGRGTSNRMAAQNRPHHERSHRAAASLSMSSSDALAESPADSSSPLSSAALSLRSLSNDTHRPYEMSAMSTSPQPAQKDWQSQAPSVPVVRVESNAAPSTSYPQQDSPPVLEAPSPRHALGLGPPDRDDQPVRRHMGSFYLRKQSSNPDLSHSLQSLSSAGEEDINDPQSGYVQFFSRFYPDHRPFGSRSGDTSPLLSPPPMRMRYELGDTRRSFNAGRPNYAMQPFRISAHKALPRPPRSPMMSAVSVSHNDDDVSEIHGLTTRASTPISYPSAPHGPEPPPDTHAPTQHLALLSTPEAHTIDAYDIGDCMGSGAYGFVRRARCRENGDEVVIKYIIKSSIFADSWRRHRVYGTIPGEIFVLLQLQHTAYTPPATPPPYLTNKEHWQHVRDEILAMQRQGRVTGHPGICKLLDFFEDEEFYYMIMPRFGNGQDLFNYVESSPYGLEPQQVRNFLGQVADVIAFMHANGVVHRDIKDENVILDSYGMVQLIDFGGAARVRPDAMFDTFSGTMDYAAVEILRGEKYTGPPQDVWAFGVLGYVLVCGECPFADVDEASTGLSPGSRALLVLQHFCHEQSHDASSDDDIPSSDGGGDLSQLCDLICQCLQPDPFARPPAHEILRHAFLFGAHGWSGLRGWQAESRPRFDSS